MRLAAAVAALCLACLGAAACAGRSPTPASLVQAQAPAPSDRLRTDNYGRLLLPRGSSVMVESDQFGYAPAPAWERTTAPPINGSDFRRLKDAFPTQLARRLRRTVRVVEAVHPDDLARDAVGRWSTTPPADVTILAFGLSEATREEDPVPAAIYAEAMNTLADRARSGGGWVVLIMPPTYPDKGLNAALQPYRAVTAAMRSQPRTLLFSVDKALAGTPGAFASKRRIGDAGQKVIGDALSGLFVITPRMR